MTKEDVFRIMGKYYGNAHYRAAMNGCYTEEELRITASFLDEINKLGYNISNIHKLTYLEDPRFLPIIFDYMRRFSDESSRAALLQAICFRSYKEATKELFTLYDDPEFIGLRWEISNALFDVREKKYLDKYLSIVNRPDYANKPDLIIEILCRFREKRILPFLLRESQNNLYIRNQFLEFAHFFREPSLLAEVEKYIDDPDDYTRALAKKAAKRIEAMQ